MYSPFLRSFSHSQLVLVPDFLTVFPSIWALSDQRICLNCFLRICFCLISGIFRLSECDTHKDKQKQLKHLLAFLPKSYILIPTKSLLMKLDKNSRRIYLGLRIVVSLPTDRSQLGELCVLKLWKALLF